MLIQDFKDFCEGKNTLFEIISNGCDSDVFIKDGGILGIELVKYYYKGRAINTIRKYYDIQSEIARKVGEISVDIQVTANDGIKCNVKVLELPNTIIYEHQERIFTTPRCIPGKTLSQSNFIPQGRIQERVNSIITNHIGIPIRIDPRNMKIVRSRDKSLSVTITDIASNIRHFVELYPNL